MSCPTVFTELIVMTPPNCLHSEQNRTTDGTKAALKSESTATLRMIQVLYKVCPAAYAALTGKGNKLVITNID